MSGWTLKADDVWHACIISLKACVWVDFGGRPCGVCFFYEELLRALLAWAAAFAPWHCMSRVSSANTSDARSPGCQEGFFFLKGCYTGVWQHLNRLGFQLLTVTCQVSMAHKDADPAFHQVNDHMSLGDMQMFLQDFCWRPSNSPDNPIMWVSECMKCFCVTNPDWICHACLFLFSKSFTLLECNEESIKENVCESKGTDRSISSCILFTVSVYRRVALSFTELIKSPCNGTKSFRTQKCMMSDDFTESTQHTAWQWQRNTQPTHTCKFHTHTLGSEGWRLCGIGTNNNDLKTIQRKHTT